MESSRHVLAAKLMHLPGKLAGGSAPSSDSRTTYLSQFQEDAMKGSRLRIRLSLALLALAVALFVLPATAPAAEPPGLQRAIQVQDRNTPWLMALPDVVGTATGLNAAGNPALKVFIAKGGVRGIPANLEGVPVVLEVTGEFFALQTTTDRWPSPVPIGVSTGNEFHCSAGTIGCRVTDGQDAFFALSNVHVFDPWHYGASPGEK